MTPAKTAREEVAPSLQAREPQCLVRRQEVELGHGRPYRELGMQYLVSPTRAEVDSR